MKTPSRNTIHDIKLTSESGVELGAYFTEHHLLNHGCFVVMDENTHRHCLPIIADALPINFQKIIIGPGELHKTIQNYQYVLKMLLQLGADRNSLVVNLGGGVVTDLGGFAAATFMRGIKFINIPTSLLGMVDASIGGKTGVDLDHYKNIAGSFSFPETVIISPEFLITLPDHEWKNGIAEMLKHGLINDLGLWNALSELLTRKNLGLTDEVKSAVATLIPAAVTVKAGIVFKDPLEKNERKFLNFGHTVAHALETYSLKHNDQPLSHGNAVAIGMVCESFISEKLCGLKSDALSKIVLTLSNLFPHHLIPKTSMQEIAHNMKSDKKASSGNVNMALISEIGSPILKEGISAELIYESLHFYNGMQI